MRDKTHVGLVDAHAERDRRHDHDAILVDKSILMARAGGGVQPSVIRQCPDAGSGERVGGVFHLGTRQAVDDARIARVPLRDESFELRGGVLLFHDLISDIRPVKTRDKMRRAIKRQPLDDLHSGQLVGGRGQCDARHVRKTFREGRQADIFRTKIVPPLRHAMRFVDRKQRDFRAIE